MNRQTAHQIGYEKRLAELTKSAGFLSGLGRAAGRAAGAFGRGAGKVKLPGLQDAIENTTLEQTLAKRKVQTAALQNRLGQQTKTAPIGELGARAKEVSNATPLPGLAPDAAAPAAPKLPGLTGRIGQAVGGMQPGIGRRILAGPQHAGASPVNPAELGGTVLRRAGGAALGAGALGGAYMKGENDAANEARRRASQLGFMQRLAFLMNPGVVNQM